MKKLSVLFFFLLVMPAFAAINPVYKECSQRGYQIYGDSCIFPDNSTCPLDEFNAGTCGSQWLTQDYCVKQGRHVWDYNRCCSGLRPYLPEGVAGQPTCEPDFLSARHAYDWSTNDFEIYLAVGVLIVIVSIGFLIFRKKK